VINNVAFHFFISTDFHFFVDGTFLLVCGTSEDKLIGAGITRNKRLSKE
jgi:hypothetical protein